jgi:uncharacterized phage protein gp47/JayE
MPLTPITFNSLVSQMGTSLTSNTPKVTNLTPGSVALAIIKSVAGVIISVQQLITYVYSVCRLATSTGPDVDSFINDYGMERLPAVPSSGSLTLTRNSTSGVLIVTVGSTAQTVINNTQFAVIADTGQPAWDPVDGYYKFNDGQGTIDVTVQAVVPGAASNVSANTITTMVSGFTGVNSITNQAAFANGEDAESDAAVKIRFPLYLASLKTASIPAVEGAILSVQAGLTYQISEYLHFDGITAFPGGFTVIVDDGSGAPDSAFLAAVAAAVEAVHAAGVEFGVYAPVVVPINVSVYIAPSNVSQAVANAAVTQAIAVYIHSLGVGVSCSLVGVANAIQSVPQVYAYANLTLNGSEADVPIAINQLAQIGTVTFVALPPDVTPTPTRRPPVDGGG